METIETPQPTQTTESKSTDWTKIILAAVLGFGLLAGSAYAGYYYGTQQVQQPEKPTPVVSQPTPTTPPPFETTPVPTPVVEDETKDWKTYTNTKYGFSIKYPPGWFTKEYVNEDAPDYFSLLFGQGKEPEEIILTGAWKDFHLDLSAYLYTQGQIQQTGINQSTGGSVSSKREHVIINLLGVSANKSFQIEEGTPPGGIPTTLIFFNFNTYGWSISYPNKDFTGNHDSIYDQILSTFKFLE